jgi:flagellar hook-associated protein 1 FlgK
MSLSASLANAMSGLTANSRAAEVVSNNVANATTEGYARQELDLSARTVGGRGAGVTIDGVSRVVDQALLRDRRLADAAVGQETVSTEFYSALERLVGTPEDASSLGGRLDALERSLIEASARPDSDARLRKVADAAVALSGQLNAVSGGIQQQRMDAETAIASQVRALNNSLSQVEKLNREILVATQSKRDASGLMDLRQRELDKISSIVPLRVVDREHGRVAVFTAQGETLVDGKAAILGFTPSRQITPEMTLGAGALSGITVNGRDVPTAGATSPLAGGSLGALFAVRDEMAVGAQTRLDAVARDLVERFADPAVDPSLAAGDPGLLTDAGGAFDAAAEVGLAGRIAVHGTVLPEAGGDLRHLRDGLQAPPGDVGNGARLTALADALAAKRTPASGDLPPNRGASGQAAFLLSEVGVARQTAETALAGEAGRQTALRAMQAADGVDTDAEMQKLMLIEQAYAANARVISVADDMMQTLLRI